jgi:hypothetical protein
MTIAIANAALATTCAVVTAVTVPLMRLEDDRGGLRATVLDHPHAPPLPKN